MSQLTWFEHFKEQLQGLNLAYEQSGSPLSLLGYALQEKHLRSEDYLQWALTHFKLPRLQKRFFTETPISQEMFAKWATHYRWSEECLPVAEWDGSLIVVCLQPPQDFPSFPPCALVISELENIQSVWRSLHAKPTPEAKTPRAAVTSEDLPEGMTLAGPSVTTSVTKVDFSADDLGLSTDENDSEESSPLAMTNESEEIAGLFQDSKVVRLQPISTNLEETISSIPENTLAIESAESDTVTPSGVEIVVNEEALIPPPPEESKTPEPVFEESFANKPIPIVPRPAGVGRPILNPATPGQFALEKLKKKYGQVLTDNIKKTLNEMKVHFDKAMILTLDEGQTQFAAFAWDEQFKDIKDSGQKFLLKTPSIFKIATETQKPFHGYISLNEVNEKFFDEWNNGVIPDHVTVAPIIFQERTVGLLLGIAEKSAYNKGSLALAEKLSSNVVNGIAA